MTLSNKYLCLVFRRMVAVRPTIGLALSHRVTQPCRKLKPLSSTFIRYHSNILTNSRENPKITCQCGTISFKASLAKPLGKYVCHCTECQKQSASAFGTSAIFPSEGMWPLPKEMQKDIGMWARLADSGNTVECYFCKVCGVRILHRVIFKDGTPRPSLSVRGGCVEGFNLEGAKHIYTRSALVPVPDDSEPGAPRVKP